VFLGDLADALLSRGEVPGAERLRAALVVPVAFEGRAFGGMVVYLEQGEATPSAAEHAYWRTAAALTGVFLAWQAAKSPTAEPRRRGAATASDRSERFSS
jgi:hypothetical protein